MYIILQVKAVNDTCLYKVPITVHSRYLGSKKPLGGFYHFINIGSVFVMFLDEYGIKLYIRDDFLSICVV